MAAKRGRSPSLTNDSAPAKRGNNRDDRPQLATEDAVLATTNSTPVTEPNTAAGAQPRSQSEVDTVQTQVLKTTVGIQQQRSNMSVAAPSVGLLVVAPEFGVVHDSWEAFEEALKAYGKQTFQLYVIRSTTSVKRRNIKIAESAAKGDAGGNAGTTRKATVGLEASMDRDITLGGRVVERTLIPEQYQWYSKSLKCTHGWKDRHRGTGKRGSGVVRSTSCPAKMCVTLQHRGPGPADWKVVVTKHVRTHNHQLSKELYLYYTENRRIYDPELLAVVGDPCEAADGAVKFAADMTSAQLTSLIDPTNQRSGLYRILTSSDDQSQQQTSSMSFLVSDSSSAGNHNESRSTKQLVALSDAGSGNFVIRPRINTTTSFNPMPPLGAIILTPGTIPSRAIDGGFCVPRVAAKVHASWDAFHDYVAQYAFDTAQVFRTRSTVSVAARNAKILASITAKTGSEDGHDVVSYASYAAASPTSRLIPDEFKWFSKLLICTYGWKRRARSKGLRLGEHEQGPCSAMLLARMERNVDGNWHVVINRQVPEHNHRLGGHVDENDTSHEFIESRDVTTASSLELTSTQPSSSDHSFMMDTQTIFSTKPSVQGPQEPSTSQREIVVRVPKLQSVFNSWDDFHTSLKAYSDATYQLYRTRTTSSAKGRNKKIAQMKRTGGQDENEDKSDGGSDLDAALIGLSSARQIPESWRWYSKTLTCTHGWKERHRGTGKRNAHGVRSTACPVKICATVQYVTPSSSLTNDALSTESGDVTRESCWRVVVTKHLVDHNHNLSRELYQHYCENRRIYDPELLAIDASSSNTVVTRKASGRLVNQPDCGSHISSQSSLLPTQLETELTEAVTHVQLSESSGSTHLVSSSAGRVPQTTAEVSTSQQTVPSVVYNPASYLPSQALAQQQEEQQQKLQQQTAAFAGAMTGTQFSQTSEGGESVATLAAAPGLTPANLVLLNNAGTMTGAFPATGSNVISVACRVHGASGRSNSSDNEISGTAASSTAQAAQCTCFRIAGGGNYVTIVPARDPLASTETNFDADEETMLYAEEMEGAWQPSSTVELEKVTTDTGEMRWRVPRIVRRYSSWEVFHKYLDAYSAATFQLYRVRTTYSVRSRNIRLRQLAASRGLTVREDGENDSTETHDGLHGVSRAHLVPEHYEWYSKTFLCTHGWKRRSRGSGQRVSHNVRATECPAKVCATLQRTDGSLNNWSVVVTKHMAEHNHELSEALYQQYSEVRRVRDPVVLAQAEQLWRQGATRRRVFEFLKERSPSQIILMKDVHNLVQRWQAQERRPRQDHDEDDQVQDQDQQLQDENTLDVSTEENTSWL